jgi:hypothetical protein
MTHAGQRVFNFAASYTGGGYKRLYEYARALAARGGATFLIHPRCTALQEEFPANHYVVVRQSPLRRLFDDGGYLDAIVREHGPPELYYAYGIPIYRSIGRLNWFHLSNVLPLRTRGIPLTPGFRLKMQYLGWRIRANLGRADVISAESEASLALLDNGRAVARVVSVNGSDDELAYASRGSVVPSEPVAIVVGTYTYKAIPDAWRVFEMRREQGDVERLVIIGEAGEVPAHIRAKSEVTVTGAIARHEVIGWLQRARVYISTTYVENSWNAAAEGVFLSEEAYLSDIGAHQELLRASPVTRVRIPGVSRELLHVRRAQASVATIQPWNAVVDTMLAEADAALASVSRAR